MGQLLGTVKVTNPNVLVDVTNFMNVTPNKRNYHGKYFSLILPSVSTANNEGLEVLDLSWNHLRMKGAVAICAGLKVWLYKTFI